MVSKDNSFFFLILLAFSVVLVVIIVAEGPEYFTKPLVYFPKTQQHFCTSKPRASSLCLPLREFLSPTPVTCFLYFLKLPYNLWSREVIVIINQITVL